MQTIERFTGKAKSYVQYRPGYPQQAISVLTSTLGWNDKLMIADIGAGTGIFTSLLLEQQLNVTAVEPNDEMRQALINSLQHYIINEKSYQRKRLVVKAGTAEATGLKDKSVQGIVCAQSFHWFEPGLARAEFNRIMSPGGNVVLIWNQRDIQASSFMKAYDELFFRYDSEYRDVKHKTMSVQALTPFYGGKAPKLESFYYEQLLDREGLIGRIQSSSFSLDKSNKHYDQFLEDCYRLFDDHQQNGYITMIYRTDVYWEKLS